MQYLTISEYARKNKITRQAVQDRIRRGKLSLAKIKVDSWRIPVEDIELKKCK